MIDQPTYAIVGATGGIGSELCRTLAATGATLFLGARHESRLEHLIAELRQDSPAVVHAFPLDATNSEEVDLFFAKAVETCGTLHGAVNLVGSLLLKPAHLTNDYEFGDTIMLNLNTAFYVLRAAARMMQTTGGSIVLASSVASKIGLANHEAIAAAKGGINGLVMAAAATYASKHIRVNAVAPALVRTPLAEKITSNELALKASTAMHPLGRIGEPTDVVAAIAWLLDPRTSWVTGQILSLDGGMSSIRGK
ncbi:SDR family NAD(P)-dependent oxidoreductase [Limnoglobus roseus]|uniref:SDR family NAD(P)-dependent oxidoreductase n=1 Tax=Limnoglobus roseus TaxID=2598579 RepID=A0A5C1A315_9BACT|nr:SDR family oxidoreductase [Limnoglobus roseus]QEL13501.1 SDR family NAD(P)-dependent oxidoreductase [Limnoglobus roseus]